MNRLFFLLVLTGILSCDKDEAFTIDCLRPGLQDGVIAFYPFSDGSLEDFSRNDNTLSNPTTATPTADRNGNLNCAYAFDNLPQDGEFLTAPNPDFLNGLSAFSISVWYQPLDDSRPPGKFESLVARGEDRRCPNRTGEWSVGLYDVRKAVFGHDNSVWASSPSEVQTWYHVVAIKDGDRYLIYLNGKPEEETMGDANCTDLRQAQDIGQLFIGSRFTGKIDDVIIYNRALATDEVADLFGLSACCSQ